MTYHKNSFYEDSISICFCLPVANVTASVLVRGTAGATAYTVNILIALATVLRKIYARAEHTADIRMALVEAFLHDSVDERTTVK